METQTNLIYREACRRSHQILATYLTLWAWKKRVDCVAVHRDQLHPYLGIAARRQQRLRWLVSDVRHLFPYTKELYQERGNKGTVYLSRRRFPDGVFEKTMYDLDRVELLVQHGLPAAMIEKLPAEKGMARSLTSVVI